MILKLEPPQHEIKNAEKKINCMLTNINKNELKLASIT